MPMFPMNKHNVTITIAIPSFDYHVILYQTINTHKIQLVVMIGMVINYALGSIELLDQYQADDLMRKD